jgi:hypothetical protein
MNTQSLDLNKMGLTPITESEMNETVGGNVFTAIGNAVSSAVDAVGSAATAVGNYVSCLYDNMSIVVGPVVIKQGCSCSCNQTSSVPQ